MNFSFALSLFVTFWTFILESGVNGLTACAVVRRHLDGQNYVIRPINCPAGETRFKANQIVKFVKQNQIVSKNVVLKIGQKVFFRFDEKDLSDAQRVHWIKHGRFTRGIPAVLAFFQTWYSTMVLSGFLASGVFLGIFLGDQHDYTPEYVFKNPADQLDRTYERLIEKIEKENMKKKKNETVRTSHASSPFFYGDQPHYVPPKNSGKKPSNTNNKRNQKCAAAASSSSSAPSSTRQQGKKGKFSTGNGGEDNQGPPTPPTPPPNKKKSFVIIIDDDDVHEEDREDELVQIQNEEGENSHQEDDDEVVFLSQQNYATDAAAVDNNDNDDEELPNEIVLSDEEGDVRVTPVGEIHINTRDRSMTVTQCLAAAPAASVSLVSPANSVITFASSSSEESLGPSLSSIQVALPAVRRNAGTLRSGPRIIQTPIPENLQWAGNLWGQEGTGMTNTCNVDSFLSQITYMTRRNPEYFDMHLNLVNSPGERAVWSISQLARSPNPEARSHSISSHRTWLNFLAHERMRTGQDPFPMTRGGAVNMAGAEGVNVLAPLRDSSNIWFIHSCQCERDSADADENQIWSAQNLHNLNSNTYDTHKSKKKCKKCKSQFNSNQRAAVSPATWFHSFQTPFEANFSDYPRTLEFVDLLTQRPVYFDVGYFTFVTRDVSQVSGELPPVSHQVSVHHIGNNYQFYDGMQRHGDYQDIPENLKDLNIMTGVIYFRRFGSI